MKFCKNIALSKNYFRKKLKILRIKNVLRYLKKVLRIAKSALIVCFCSRDLRLTVCHGFLASTLSAPIVMAALFVVIVAVAANSNWQHVLSANAQLPANYAQV